MSMMVSFVLSFFPRDVLDEILNLIESVSEDFPSYSCLPPKLHHLVYEELHQKLGQLGADRVITFAKDRFHWPGIGF